ncbi:MAG: hypothetical protein JKY10_09820 [Cohaesibacteraceae bacterium]|nr:hypothetical protein [Cohaesibacteraceae bacterium]
MTQMKGLKKFCFKNVENYCATLLVGGNCKKSKHDQGKAHHGICFCGELVSACLKGKPGQIKFALVFDSFLENTI